MKLCEEYAALLDMYVDGFCTAEETVRVRAHLAECEACRMYVEQILQMKEAFPDAESEEVPDGFAENVMAVIRAEAPARKKRMKPWQKTLLQMAACMAVVIALGPLSEMLTGRGMEKTAQDAAVEMSMAGAVSKAQAPMAPDMESAMVYAADAADHAAPPAADGSAAVYEARVYGRTAAVRLTACQQAELLAGHAGEARDGAVDYTLTEVELEAVLAKLPEGALILGGTPTDNGSGICLLTVYPAE